MAESCWMICWNTQAVTPVLYLQLLYMDMMKVSWWTSCNVNHLLHILHVPHCLASEICQWGGAGAAPRCRMSPPCIRLWRLSMCRGSSCDWHLRPDTVTGGAASQTADCYSRVGLNAAAYVVIGLVIVEGLVRQEERTATWFIVVICHWSTDRFFFINSFIFNSLI